MSSSPLLQYTATPRKEQGFAFSGTECNNQTKFITFLLEKAKNLLPS
jgi:hypothetical protein